MSKLYSIEFTQKIPVDLDTLWDFISSPRNLKTITPPHMGFEITTRLDSETMYPGQIIAYKVSPLLGIKMEWVTEITHVQDKHYFVDEQRFGPYALWHHKHFLQPIEKGVLMTDIIHYKIPMGFLGDIAQGILVKPQLEKIFSYRFKKLEEMYGKFPE
jgi:ligand-binding SRPBCC domain-containing protein